MKPRTGPRRNLDSRMLTVYDDDSGVSRRSSPAAHARAPGPYADTYVVAVNLVDVESDGSRPDRPDYLRGGGQARRHRAACNRGHGLLRGCVEFRNDPDVNLGNVQPSHYRRKTDGRQAGAGACNVSARRASRISEWGRFACRRMALQRPGPRPRTRHSRRGSHGRRSQRGRVIRVRA